MSVIPIIKGSEGKLKFNPSDIPNSFKLIANGVEKIMRYMIFSISKMAKRITNKTKGSRLKM